MWKSGLTSGTIIPGALSRPEEVGVLMLRGGLGRHGVPAASTVATGSSPFLAFQRVGSTNLTNIHLLPERKTNGGLENGGVGAFMALRCGACIGAPACCKSRLGHLYWFQRGDKDGGRAAWRSRGHRALVMITGGGGGLGPAPKVEI